MLGLLVYFDFGLYGVTSRTFRAVDAPVDIDVDNIWGYLGSLWISAAMEHLERTQEARFWSIRFGTCRCQVAQVHVGAVGPYATCCDVVGVRNRTYAHQSSPVCRCVCMHRCPDRRLVLLEREGMCCQGRVATACADALIPCWRVLGVCPVTCRHLSASPCRDVGETRCA